MDRAHRIVRTVRVCPAASACLLALHRRMSHRADDAFVAIHRESAPCRPLSLGHAHIQPGLDHRQRWAGGSVICCFALCALTGDIVDPKTYPLAIDFFSKTPSLSWDRWPRPTATIEMTGSRVMRTDSRENLDLNSVTGPHPLDSLDGPRGAQKRTYFDVPEGIMGT